MVDIGTKSPGTARTYDVQGDECETKSAISLHDEHTTMKRILETHTHDKKRQRSGTDFRSAVVRGNACSEYAHTHDDAAEDDQERTRSSSFEPVSTDARGHGPRKGKWILHSSYALVLLPNKWNPPRAIVYGWRYDPRELSSSAAVPERDAERRRGARCMQE